MGSPKIGIIGGTGLGDAILQAAPGEPVKVDTPFGAPSADPIVANWEGSEIVFLQRHGEGHRLSPSAVPYRANIFALKSLGVDTIIASGATGSLREDVEPGHLVLCDQVIDKTFRRDGTFFDEGLAVHVEFADPFCPALRQVLASAGEACYDTVHHAGTYICMEGPQFSTRAESHMHRAWGGDLIGMTCMPEAKLAREAEMCYVLVALPTDYDCWRPHDESAGKSALLEEIIGNLHRATEAAVKLISCAVRALGETRSWDCGCRSALELAIWTNRASIDAATKDRLAPLIGRYLDEM